MEEVVDSSDTGIILKCIRIVQEGAERAYYFLDMEGNTVRYPDKSVLVPVKIGDTFAVLDMKEYNRPVLKKLFEKPVSQTGRPYPKKELAITFYAFAENEVNTAAYKRVDTIDEAIEFFKQLLAKPEISIINIRKLKLKNGEEVKK